MRLRTLGLSALVFAISTAFAVPPVEARAPSPVRHEVVTLTTGDSTTYVVKRQYKKKKKKKSKAKKKRNPASSKKKKSKGKHKKAKSKKKKKKKTPEQDW